MAGPPAADGRRSGSRASPWRQCCWAPCRLPPRPRPAYRLGHSGSAVADRRPRARACCRRPLRRWSRLSYAALTVRRRAAAVAVAARRLSPGPQPDRLAGLGDRAADGRRAELLFPLYASLFTPVWLRAARREGRPQHRDLHSAADAEVHRVERRVPGRRHDGGVLRARRRLDARRRAKIGKRAFLGNSGMTAPGGRCPRTASSRCCPRHR